MYLQTFFHEILEIQYRTILDRRVKEIRAVFGDLKENFPEEYWPIRHDNKGELSDLVWMETLIELEENNKELGWFRLDFGFGFYLPKRKVMYIYGGPILPGYELRDNPIAEELLRIFLTRVLLQSLIDSMTKINDYFSRIGDRVSSNTFSILIPTQDIKSSRDYLRKMMKQIEGYNFYYMGLTEEKNYSTDPE